MGMLASLSRCSTTLI
uniref:Uncharacterized protein n=1 Tax=Anguilla anguilla TaxID=7936 RepID=A0A0E9VWA3_ANGAN